MSKTLEKKSTIRAKVCRCFIDADFGRFLPTKGRCPIHKESNTRLIGNPKKARA